jgi:hypothetical protein
VKAKRHERVTNNGFYYNGHAKWFRERPDKSKSKSKSKGQEDRKGDTRAYITGYMKRDKNEGKEKFKMDRKESNKKEKEYAQEYNKEK